MVWSFTFTYIKLFIFMKFKSWFARSYLHLCNESIIRKHLQLISRSRENKNYFGLVRGRIYCILLKNILTSVLFLSSCVDIYISYNIIHISIQNCHLFQTSHIVLLYIFFNFSIWIFFLENKNFYVCNLQKYWYKENIHVCHDL